MKGVAFALAALILLPGTTLGEDQPIDIVRDLYATYPHETDPPGGMARWTPDMQALWAELNEKQTRWMSGEVEFVGEGLNVDFLIGTHEEWFDALKLKTVIQVEYEAQVLAVLNNGADAPYALRFGFVRDDEDGWQIAEVWRDGSWVLSEQIQQTR